MREIEKDLIARLVDGVKEQVRQHLLGLPLQEVASLDRVEEMTRELAHRMGEGVFAVWAQVLEEVSITLAGQCPGCGKARKVKRRASAPMQVSVLGMMLSVPKPYLECDCEVPGVSIVRVLTGLSSGDKSGELELMAAYCAAEHSYGKASRDLEVHHGQLVERTAVRRMALEVEQDALEFAESERRELLEQVGQEQRREGKARLMLQGDGGTVRTGQMEPCGRGDPGCGKTTPKTGRPRRKRPTQYREIITLDVREPGEATASALDVVVPSAAPEGERARRMLALAARKGLGDNTEVFGLGDMGSSLPSSFDEAFVGYTALYSADWKHTYDYVDKASAHLRGERPERWVKAMKDALWERNRPKADKLIERARQRRVADLPPHLEKCPVQTLATYIDNNWDRLHAKAFKEQGLDFVSARAESQVRDRTKSRYAVPGAWKQENLEGKAVLRSVIADCRWPAFREHYLHTKQRRHRAGLSTRVHAAIAKGQLAPTCLDQLDTAPPATEAHAKAA